MTSKTASHAPSRPSDSSMQFTVKKQHRVAGMREKLITSMVIIHGEHEDSMQTRAQKGGTRVKIRIARDLVETFLMSFT